MKNRKGTPDIMGDLMGSSTARDRDNNKTIKPVSNNTIRPAIHKAIKQEGNKSGQEEPKEKATFNLSLSSLEALEDAWIELRRNLKQRVTKTLLVEKALEIALEDLKNNGPKSALYKILLDGEI